MNYSLLSIFFGSRSRTDSSDSRTGTYLQELLISFLVFSLIFGRTLDPASTTLSGSQTVGASQRLSLVACL